MWYRWTLKPLAPFTQWPTSDLLMGQLAWAYRDCHSEASMRSWLDQFREQTPPFVVSDAWLEDTLPRPAGSSYTRARWSETDKAGRIQALEDRKRWKASRLLTYQEFWAVVGGQGDENQTFETPRPHTVSVHTVHTGVDRITGGARDGELFTREGWWSSARLQIYVWSEPNSEVEMLARVLSYQGIGGEISSGFGQVEWVEWREWEWPSVAEANGEVWLGHGVPTVNAPMDGFYHLHTKYGRVWGPQHPSPWKVPILQVQPGAVWHTKEPWKGWAGRALSEIHESPEVIDFGYTVTVPMRLPNAEAQEDVNLEDLNYGRNRVYTE